MDIVSLGLGGLVGAAAAAALAGLRVKAAFDSFATAFGEYFRDKRDPESAFLKESFDDLAGDISLFASAFDRLKRAFKRK